MFRGKPAARIIWLSNKRELSPPPRMVFDVCVQPCVCFMCSECMCAVREDAPSFSANPSCLKSEKRCRNRVLNETSRTAVVFVSRSYRIASFFKFLCCFWFFFFFFWNSSVTPWHRFKRRCHSVCRSGSEGVHSSTDSNTSDTLAHTILPPAMCHNAVCSCLQQWRTENHTKLSETLHCSREPHRLLPQG